MAFALGLDGVHREARTKGNILEATTNGGGTEPATRSRMMADLQVGVGGRVFWAFAFWAP